MYRASESRPSSWLGTLTLRTATVRDVIKELHADGWTQTAQRGNHRQFEHPTKAGKVTVPGAVGDDIARGTLASVRRQAGIRGNQP